MSNLIYWFHGQSGCGKTDIAKKFKWWLQTDKRNWRKSVFHIDENDIRELYDVANVYEIEQAIYNLAIYLHATGHDVVVSTRSPNSSIMENKKQDGKVKEIYCKTNKMLAPEKIIKEYELPIGNCIQLDTTEEVEETFKKLLKILL